MKDNSVNKTDASIVASNSNAAPEIQEKIVETHHNYNSHNHSTVNKADVDKKDGSISDGGSSGGIGGVVKRRNRYTNGTLIRSHSFDNGKYDSVHGRILSKSKTLGSSSMSSSTSSSRLRGGGSKKKRIKTLSANGSNHCSVDRLDETRTDCKRRRLFRASNVDQSPLWTTLTHARTMSDFVFDS